MHTRNGIFHNLQDPSEHCWSPKLANNFFLRYTSKMRRIIILPEYRAAEEEECAICFEVITPLQGCYACSENHKFHCECIETWQQQEGTQPTCPTCRREITKRHVNDFEYFTEGNHVHMNTLVKIHSDSVTIPESVTQIGRGEKVSKSMSQITFTRGLQSIYDFAFYSNKLTDVDLFNTQLTTIGVAAFMRNPLKRIKFPNTLIRIGNLAFYGNQLSSVDVPYNVQHIGEKAFYDNQLERAFLPGVKSIGDYAFAKNKLIVVVFPIVNTIGIKAFAENKLKGVAFPGSLSWLSKSAFHQAFDEEAFDGETSVTFQSPSQLKRIGEYTFANNKLSSVTFPDSLEHIYKFAFQNNRLESVSFPAKLKTIRNHAFYNNRLKSVDFLHDLTSIGDSAFQKNQLKSVRFPAKLNTIGNSAFYNNQLKSVDFPHDLTSIGDSAFYDNQLESVSFKPKLRTIGHYAFENNQLTEVKIPKDLANLGVHAFGPTLDPLKITAPNEKTRKMVNKAYEIRKGWFQFKSITPWVKDGEEFVLNQKPSTQTHHVSVHV